MSNSEIKSRFYILHVEVAHGSDRYDIHLHLERLPIVRDLMEEVEKKSRVTLMNQQLIFRGQRLHQTPDKELEKFGIFNGNHIVLIGQKLSGKEDEHFRRLLDIEKNIKLIDDVLELICRDLENIKFSRQPRNRCEHFLIELNARTERCRNDLQTFYSIVQNLDVQSQEIDASRKKLQVTGLIQDRIGISSNIIGSVANYQGSDEDQYYASKN